MSALVFLANRSFGMVAAPCLFATLWMGMGSVAGVGRAAPHAIHAEAAPDSGPALGTAASVLVQETPAGVLLQDPPDPAPTQGAAAPALDAQTLKAAVAQGPPDTLSGLVFDQTTGNPVAGVAVELLEFDGGSQASLTLSDGQGRFALPVPEGHFWLVASRTGYAGSAPREVLWDRDSESVAGVLLPIQDLDAESVSIRAEEEGGEGPARLLGRVMDHESVRPVAEAEVELAVSGLRTLTDRNGMFTFQEVPAGQEVVHLRHLGYGEEIRVVDLAGGTAYRLDGRLSPDPIELEGIEVRATSSSWFRRMDDLRFRMERGISSNFILAEKLAVRGYPPLADVLRDVPGLRVLGNGIDRRVLVSRCGDGEPVIYLDGIKVHRPGGGPMFVLSEVVSMDVEAIEVYKGPASIPAQFIDSDTQCGVILIWTKR